AALLLAVGSLAAQTNPPAGPGPDATPRRTLRAAAADATVTLDGRLDEAAWAQAEPAVDWVQQRPRPGAPASQRTEARVLYDAGAVYVGMRMYDTAPDSVVAPLARRDYIGFSDWANVLIDSYHDRRTAYRFSVNPAGVKKDVFYFNDMQEDVGWDAVWDVATQRDSAGWTAEFRIPLSQLRFSRGDAGERTWGINFFRDIARLNERSYWSPMPPDAPGFVSRFGELAGLGELAPPRRLEVVPYTMARVTRAPDAPGDPFYQENDTYGTVGGDLKYGITSNLTLTATINPDFGQVEADPSQVNLTAFEIFFPEKRPFFLEGADIFRFDIDYRWNIRGKNFAHDQVFYSRRIGRQPQGFLPAGTVFFDAPTSTRILGAAKVSGKTAGGWSVGFLDAVSAEETARYADLRGNRGSTVVEPLSNYAVARASRDFRNGASAIGGIFSAAHRRLDGTGMDFLRSSAYTAGVDGRHRFGGGNYEVRGALLGSHVEGSRRSIFLTQIAPGRYFQRPDADYVELDPERTSLSGILADARVERIGGGPWRWGLVGHAISPGFEINDVGFQPYPDWAIGTVYLEYNQFRPGRVFQR
ncbi:MAG TPA: DUF5916 domain-containing protein, partial [Longimicrobiaceae bacterium]|nr:DUF5916 domain-containing protein [Longimicrobiaceae bacterium]